TRRNLEVAAKSLPGCYLAGLDSVERVLFGAPFFFPGTHTSSPGDGQLFAPVEAGNRSTGLGLATLALDPGWNADDAMSTSQNRLPARQLFRLPDRVGIGCLHKLP